MAAVAAAYASRIFRWVLLEKGFPAILGIMGNRQCFMGKHFSWRAHRGIYDPVSACSVVVNSY